MKGIWIEPSLGGTCKASDLLQSIVKEKSRSCTDKKIL